MLAGLVDVMRLAGSTGREWDHLALPLTNFVYAGPVGLQRLHQLHSLFKAAAGSYEDKIAVLKLLEHAIHGSTSCG
jgi:uncharacterized protein YgfB (UPF0149 family)